MTSNKVLTLLNVINWFDNLTADLHGTKLCINSVWINIKIVIIFDDLEDNQTFKMKIIFLLYVCVAFAAATNTDCDSSQY